MLLECQVAIQDMTQAISYLIKDKLGQVYHLVYADVHLHMQVLFNAQMPCQLYPVLIDSFEEYRLVIDQNSDTLLIF